jgi:hypothetical protein
MASRPSLTLRVTFFDGFASLAYASGYLFQRPVNGLLKVSDQEPVNVSGGV